MDNQPMRDGDKTKDAARPGPVGIITPTATRNPSDSPGSPGSPAKDGNHSTGVVGETMDQAVTMARNVVGEQAWSAAADVATNAGNAAQDLARRAREQTSATADTLYKQGARASEYLTRNVNEYPLTALLIAGAIGYGIAFLMHNTWQGDSKDK